MAVELEGGCFVTRRSGAPSWSQGNVRIWDHVGRSSGSRAITLRTIELGRGAASFAASPSEEVLFVLGGRGTIAADGGAIEVGEGCGVHVEPGRVVTLENDSADPMILLSSQCPDPRQIPAIVDRPPPNGPAPKLVRLEDQISEATGDRWYKVMINSEVTQFVGAIPPGRAPDHFHHYEEVIFILTGTGRMWAGSTSTPVEAGACIFLPKKQRHCLENTGVGEMRLLGVFYPFGEPGGPLLMMRYAFLVLEEHPYGREMLSQLLEAGLVPELMIEERSADSDLEREKFLTRIAGHEPAPTFTELLRDRTTRRVQLADHNSEECAMMLRDLRPDLIVLGGTRILKPRIFSIAKTLNSHPGLLPEVRGSASVAWAIHLDVPIGCTCHFVEAGIDTGAIVGRRTIEVHLGDTYEDLCYATLRLSGTLMREALESLSKGELIGTPQPPGQPALRNMPEDMVERVKEKLAKGGYRHYASGES